MRSVFRVTWCAAIVAAMACTQGSGAPTTSGVTPSRTMSATIDGVAWNPSSVGANAQPALITIFAFSGSGTAEQTTIDFHFLRTGLGTQTFVAGAGATEPTATITVGSVAQQVLTWTTGLTGGSGTVTLTILTTNRAAGTFSFVAQGLGSTITPKQRQVTNGQFDVAF